MTPNEIRQLAKAQQDAAEAIMAQAAGDKRAMTVEEETQFDGHIAERNRLVAQADKVESARPAVNNARPVFATPTDSGSGAISVGKPGFESDPRRGFRSHRDFLMSIINQSRGMALPGDTTDKLKSLAQDLGEGQGYMLPSAFAPKRFTAGSDEIGTYDDAHGGGFIEKQMLPGIRETMWSGDPTSGLTTSIPMSSPTVELTARVDKNHASSVSGGFRVYRTSETQETAASRAEFEQITLRASKLMGLAYCTSEMLNYSPVSFIAIINSGFQTEFSSKVLDEKLRGTGAGEYAGILSTATNPSLISITKETNQAADTIVYANLVKMRSRIWAKTGRPVWMIVSDALEQLMQMVNAAGQLVWQPDATGASPGSIFGLPIVEAEEMSGLGDVGDIALVNWAEYLEGTLRPVESASSIHVRFLNDETAFRFTLSNAGAPWWRTALTPKHGQTKSPFVVLGAR